MRAGMMLGSLMLIAMSGLCGCHEDGGGPLVENGPTVLHQGPGPGESVTAIWGRLEDGDIYAQFGDPQGFEDLSTARLSVEETRILDVIGRDYFREQSFCNGSGAIYDEDLPFDLKSMLPTSFGGISNTVAFHSEGLVDISGLFCFSEWCDSFLSADLLTTESTELGPSVEGGCTTGMALLGVYPPLRDPASDIIITMIELEFVNVRLEIFDAAGHATTAVWPSLTVHYQHDTPNP